MLSLDLSQRVCNDLSGLYSRWGYSRYTMSKFEEYDLYARNKDFLISDSVITFTDRNGKLMALKPDVTLSIVKNSKDGEGVQKLYYTENVYRVAKGSDSFKEILQMGLECIGTIDDYTICEVLQLAAESLGRISSESVLDISHLGLLSALIDDMGVSEDGKASLLACIGEKNCHELTSVCRRYGLQESDVQTLCGMVEISGTPSVAMPKLKALLGGRLASEVSQLDRLFAALVDSSVMLRLDFSVVDDLHYYNGIVFKGFVAGIPASVLSGGQYDKLMQKMKRTAGAIGFAVYMDMLEWLEQPRDQYDVDILLIYRAGMQPASVAAMARKLMADGKTVLVQSSVPEGIRYRQLVNMEVAEC